MSNKSFNLPEDHILDVHFFGSRGGSNSTRYLDMASATAVVSNSEIASVVIDGDVVVVTPKATGTVTVTVTADADPSDARAFVSGSFDVNVIVAQAEVVDFGEGFVAPMAAPVVAPAPVVADAPLVVEPVPPTADAPAPADAGTEAAPVDAPVA